MNCIYCGDNTDLKNGDIEGRIGMTEIAFCTDCYPLVSGWIFYVEGMNPLPHHGGCKYESSK